MMKTVTFPDVPDMTSLSVRPHLMWVDALRVLACFMVVMAHGCDAFVGLFDANPQAFLTGSAIGSLMRPCVPLFVMMTAVLIMPVGKDMTLARFYAKRVGRILWPLIFWSLALPILMFLYFRTPLGANTSSSLIDVSGYTTERLGYLLWSWLLNFNFDTTILWYLYMLVGIYLIVPLIDGWLSTASRNDLKVLLGVWIVTLIIPYVKLVAPMLGYQGNYGHMGILGECDWNPYGMFYYVSGFMGYLVLARYLVRFPLDWSNRKKAGILLPMFVIGYVLTFQGYVLLQKYFPGNYAFLEIVWYFCSINVLMMTFPVFVAMQSITGTAFPWLSKLAQLTFGIYLCHFVFEFVGYDLFDISVLPVWLRIVASSIFSFVAAACVTWLFKQNKYTARLVS